MLGSASLAGPACRYERSSKQPDGEPFGKIIRPRALSKQYQRHTPNPPRSDRTIHARSTDHVENFSVGLGKQSAGLGSGP